MSAFAAHRHRLGDRQVVSLEWSTWLDVGMNANVPRHVARSHARERGLHVLDAKQGLASPCAALTTREPVVTVGIDASSDVARRFVDDSVAAELLLAYVAPKSAIREVASLLADPFGSPIPVDERV